MYWNLLKAVILTFAPVVPVHVKWTRIHPDKNEWKILIVWKSPFALVREVYLEHYPPVKTE